MIGIAARPAFPWLMGAIAVGLMAASGAGAWTVATWRAEAAHAGQVGELTTQIATLTGQKHELELAIGEANKAIAVAAAQTQAAEQAQAQAQKHADELADFSKSRLDKLATVVASANGCSDVLSRYWEIRK